MTSSTARSSRRHSRTDPSRLYSAVTASWPYVHGYNALVTRCLNWQMRRQFAQGRYQRTLALRAAVRMDNLLAWLLRGGAS